MTGIERVAVVGSGYMGGGMAQVFALAGVPVVLADVSGEVARSNRERLVAESARFADEGLFPADAAARVDAALRAAETIEEAAAGADFVQEAVPERLDVKEQTLGRIAAAARRDAIIGSNTSTISIATLAGFVSEPARFLGVHFSNPAPFIPGVEVIPHPGTAADVVARVEALLDRSGKSHAVLRDTTGFVVNRLQYALFQEATRLAEEGIATPEDIDTLVRTTFGFRLPFFGPFAVADMAGLDVYAFCYRSLGEAYPERFPTPPLLTRLVEEGRLGTKSGAGFFERSPESTAELIRYRDRAYAAMSRLLEELGPPPR